MTSGSGCHPVAPPTLPETVEEPAAVEAPPTAVDAPPADAAADDDLFGEESGSEKNDA